MRFSWTFSEFLGKSTNFGITRRDRFVVDGVLEWGQGMCTARSSCDVNSVHIVKNAEMKAVEMKAVEMK